MKKTNTKTYQTLVYFCLKGLRNLYDTHLHRELKDLTPLGVQEKQEKTEATMPPFSVCRLLYLLCQDMAENKPHRQRLHFKPSHVRCSSPVLKFLAVTTWPLFILPLLPSKHGQLWHNKKHICPFTIFLLIFISYTYSLVLLSHLPSLQVGGIKPPFFLYIVLKSKIS